MARFGGGKYAGKNAVYNALMNRRLTRKKALAVQLPRGGPRTSRLRMLGAAARRLTRSKAKTRLSNPMIRKVVRGAIGGQATFSSFRASNRPNPRVRAMKKVGAANYYVINEAAQLICDEGFQQAGAWAFQSTADLKRIALNVPGHIPPGNTQPVQYVLESAKAEYMITNSTLATMYIDIYDIVRKRDADLNVDNGTQNPREAWRLGTDNETNLGVDVYKNINSLPTDSRLLKEYFKIVQRSHIGLAQGATHKHHVSLRSNKLISTALLDEKEDPEDLAGLSVYTMIVVWGQPASVKPEGGGPAVVTTASGAIDVVKAVRYKYTWVSDTANNFYYVDNLPSLPNELVVSAGAGQLLPNIYA